MTMNPLEIKGAMDCLRAYFKFTPSENSDAYSSWVSELGRMDLGLFKQTIHILNAQARESDNYECPTLNKVIHEYIKVKKQSRSHSLETDCCTKGFRFALATKKRDGIYYINLKRMSCKNDEPNTKYDNYHLERIPCKCSVGKEEMKRMNFELTDRSLEIFFENSFIDPKFAQSELSKVGIDARW